MRDSAAILGFQYTSL